MPYMPHDPDRPKWIDVMVSVSSFVGAICVVALFFLMFY